MESNGALMRCLPLVFEKEAIVEDCNLTNPNDVSRYCSERYLQIIRHLLQNKKINIFKKSEIKSIDEAIDDIINKKDRDLTKNKGWVVHAFYCALYCYKYFDDYTNALKWLAEKSGDVDTNMAIALGMLGAKLGYKKLMEEQGNNVKNHVRS